MRICSIGLLLLAAVVGNAGDAPPSAKYPLWDGHESIEQYAVRTGLASATAAADGG
ncbi:MAG TPA: hypothetical protein VGP72_12635 [Planctomycetota bacterium]